MCDPMTAFAAFTATAMAGDIVGGIQQRGVARANASVMRAEAGREAQLGALRESAVRREYRQRAGLQRSQLAASGVTLDSLSSLDLGADLGTQGFMEAQNVRLDSGARRQQLKNSAALQRAEGNAAILRGVTSATGRALNAAPTLWPGLGGG